MQDSLCRGRARWASGVVLLSRCCSLSDRPNVYGVGHFMLCLDIESFGNIGQVVSAFVFYAYRSHVHHYANLSSTTDNRHVRTKDHGYVGVRCQSSPIPFSRHFNPLSALVSVPRASSLQSTAEARVPLALLTWKRTYFGDSISFHASY